ncbi:DUF6093 family protein [Rhodococcus qingshengii]|uniref:DUF6093 family protein n=1 Tax=Rhodococcus qingshengii TaxID=334542 RepID=UPI0035D999EB
MPDQILRMRKQVSLMSMLHNRRALDPRWSWHQRSVPIGHMNSVVEIFRRTGDSKDYGYDILTGDLMDTSTGQYPGMVLLYRGQARGVTNKDWRSRVRTARGDSGIQHAIRFQVPERECPPVHAHDVLRVVSAPPNEEIQHFIFHVRNPSGSTNAWLRNLLCDVDVAHAQMLPPPYTGTPIAPEDAPQPFNDCGCG